jgi:hypothetical protein
MRLAALTLAGVVLAGCSAVGGAGSPAPSLIAVPTQSPVPANETPGPCPAAQTEGELIADDRWGIVLDEGYLGEIRRVIWPYGFAARHDGDRLALLNQAGEIVAHEGDLVRIDGGEVSPDSWRNCGSVTVLRPW